MRDNIILEIPSGDVAGPLRGALQAARVAWKRTIPGAGPHPQGPLGPVLWEVLCIECAECENREGAGRTRKDRLDVFRRLVEAAAAVGSFGPLGARRLEAGPPDGVWIWSLCPTPHTEAGRAIRMELARREDIFSAFHVKLRPDNAPMQGVERRLREVVLGERAGGGRGRGRGGAVRPFQDNNQMTD